MTQILLFKIAGIALVNMCSIAAAWNKADKYRLNEAYTRCAQLMIDCFAQEMRCTNGTVYDALSAIAGDVRFENLSFLSKADELCENGMDFPSACAKAVDSAQGNYSRELLDSMREFFSGLGRSDLDGQLKHCEYYSARLAQSHDKAKRELDVNYRFTMKIGVLAGAFVSVLMI